ncbi:TetR/AcrR family transcriptional regulator [Amycolatopsis keratiniphila]|uniref:TetR/AcrR family transcriptional regulator n=1 Tax=Amycolatopsis keratiniphila TaxID=129921 RepID=UPI000879FC7F|nr:TetR family transcriptional regulator [Amycolatopsis keratiniphila]OLZ59620.1 TetR family transcriptional regulator [Amycolatopsis keratiniphila subsp. nogabecina]SDU54287.1 DNA-binding transcriptional regulator, AcrR family [Amycolatopsis keratiniphila]
MSLRDRQRAETRLAVQTHAIRLFTDVGYDATTVADVAAAAGVSAMTAYRHFPTKEDLVLYDEYDPVTASAVATAPPGPLPARIGHALSATAAHGSSSEKAFLLARLRLMISVPALRARHLDSQYATADAIVAALDCSPEEEFRVRATAMACLGAAHVALVRWAETDGEADLAGLIRETLTSVFET